MPLLQDQGSSPGNHPQNPQLIIQSCVFFVEPSCAELATVSLQLCYFSCGGSCQFICCGTKLKSHFVR